MEFNSWNWQGKKIKFVLSQMNSIWDLYKKRMFILMLVSFNCFIFYNTNANKIQISIKHPLPFSQHYSTHIYVWSLYETWLSSCATTHPKICFSHHCSTIYMQQLVKAGPPADCTSLANCCQQEKLPCSMITELGYNAYLTGIYKCKLKSTAD